MRKLKTETEPQVCKLCGRLTTYQDPRDWCARCDQMHQDSFNPEPPRVVEVVECLNWTDTRDPRPPIMRFPQTAAPKHRGSYAERYAAWQRSDAGTGKRLK